MRIAIEEAQAIEAVFIQVIMDMGGEILAHEFFG
jgi:hypothetical protein